VRDREFVCKGALWGLAKAGVFSPRGTGMADGTALETTERDPGGGQVTRQVRLAETWGNVHEIKVTVDGWTVRLLIAAVTQMPWALNVAQRQDREAPRRRGPGCSR
jgi:hypothetical protein